MMRSLRSSSLWAGISPIGPALMVLAAILPIVGCGGLVGGEPPKSEAQSGSGKTVQELAKEGRSIQEIRAIMRGKPLPDKKKKVGRKR